MFCFALLCHCSASLWVFFFSFQQEMLCLQPPFQVSSVRHFFPAMSIACLKHQVVFNWALCKSDHGSWDHLHVQCIPCSVCSELKLGCLRSSASTCTKPTQALSGPCVRPCILFYQIHSFHFISLAQKIPFGFIDFFPTILDMYLLLAICSHP